MRTYLTGDPHFNCPRLVENTRPWTTVEDHDKDLIEVLNRVVGRNDRLIICGDFCKGKPFKWREQIKCRNIWLVLGNHDKRSDMVACFGADRVRDSLMVKLGESRVFCSHYCHAYWDRSHYGVMHAYGHSHSQREAEMDEKFPGRRSMDVGIDNAVRFFGSPVPFPEEWFTDVLMSRPGHDMIQPDQKWAKKDYGPSE